MSVQLVSGLVLWSISLSVGQQLGCLICFSVTSLILLVSWPICWVSWNPDFGIGGPSWG